ncbi:MAG: hypothetical protein PVG14_18350 [Anaerolineales bacterium]
MKKGGGMIGYQIKGTVVIGILIFGLMGCRSTNPMDKIDEWDLVYISDSTGWGVAEKYGRNIERYTGKTVNVHNYAMGNMSALRVLNALRSDPPTHPLQADIQEAEVIVFFANPRGPQSEGGVQGGMEKCIAGRYAPDDCSLQLYEPYIKNLISIYQEIFRLRDGEATIIRAIGFYNPLISRHRENGIDKECTECFETFNQAVHMAADEFGIPFVSVFDAFNGVNHDEDPREKGYIGSDGIHASEEGQQVIADILSESGYEPMAP